MDKKKLRLLADRLCYLEQGNDGLCWRNGHKIALRTVGGYRDKYDVQAEALYFTVWPKPVEMRQLELFNA